MINEFLTKLDNRNPVFAWGDKGIIRDPSSVKPYTGLKGEAWAAIFGNANTHAHLCIAAELVLLLRNSPLASWETVADSRVTYNDATLADFLMGGTDTVSGTDHPVSLVLDGDTPNRAAWSVTYSGSGSFTAQLDGEPARVISSIDFSGESTVISLPGGAGLLFVGEPPTGGQWTVVRDAGYISQLANIDMRLSELDIDSMLPIELQKMYRSARVAPGLLRPVIAAVGVVYGD